MTVGMFGATVRKKADIIMGMGETIKETQMSTVFLRGLLPEFHTIATQLRNDDLYDYDYIVSEVVKYAKDNKIQGLKKKKSTSDGPGRGAGTAFTTELICNNFSKYGKCKFGEKCKYKHIKADVENKGAKKIEGPRSDEGPKCFNCKKPGHKQSECTRKAASAKVATVDEEDQESEYLPAYASVAFKSSVLADWKGRRIGGWIFDTGASHFMSWDKSDFVPGSMRTVDVSLMPAVGDVVKITQMGTCYPPKGTKYYLHDVLYAPDAPCKLYSGIRVDLKGGSWSGSDGHVKIFSKEGALTATASRKKNIYLIDEVLGGGASDDMLLTSSNSKLVTEKNDQGSIPEGGSSEKYQFITADKMAKPSSEESTFSQDVKNDDSKVDAKVLGKDAAEVASEKGKNLKKEPVLSGPKFSKGKVIDAKNVVQAKPMQYKAKTNDFATSKVKGTMLAAHSSSKIVEDKGDGGQVLDAVAMKGNVAQVRSNTDLEEMKRKIWQFHLRKGHPSMSICRAELGYPAARPGEDPSCETCEMMKSKRASLPSTATTRAAKCGLRIFWDRSGRKPPTFHGNKFFDLFVDDHSRKIFVKLQKRGTEAVDALDEIKRLIENQCQPNKLAFLRTDGAKEFVHVAQRYCSENGIEFEQGSPYRPEQSGVVQLRVGQVWKVARTMMAYSNSPKGDWGYAVVYAVFLLNELPTEANGGLTPNEIWTGVQRNYEIIGIFGCLCFAKIYVRGVMDPNSRRCVFLGKMGRSYLVRDLSKPGWKTYLSADVVFYENNFPYRSNLVPRPIERVDSDDDQDYVEDDLFEGEHRVIENKDAEEDYQVVERQYKADMDEERKVAEEAKIEEAGQLHEENNQEEAKRQQPQRSRSTSERGIESAIYRADHERRPEVMIPAVAMKMTDRQDKDMERIPDPANTREARDAYDAAEFLEAEQDELKSIYEHNTWELVLKKPGMNILGNRFVYHRKRDESGKVIRRKVRLVVQGFKMRPDIDFKETFSATVRTTAIRIIFAITAYYDLELLHGDIKTFFLYGRLKEDVYMHQVKGYEEAGPEYVCKVNQALYGTKQAAREANETLVNDLIEVGFKQCINDYLVFIIREDEEAMIMGVHVDDFVAGSTSIEFQNKIMDKIQKKYKMVLKQNPTMILGCQVDRDRVKGTIKIHQQSHVEKTLTMMNMADCKPVDSPMVPGLTLPEPSAVTMTDDDKELPFQRGVGLLIWLLITRIDIAFAVGVLCRYMAKYNDYLFKLMKRVLRYLKGTSDFGLEYKRAADKAKFSLVNIMILIMLCDADNASRIHDSRSTTSWFAMLMNGIICFKSSVQRTIALSTVESEFVALKDACQEIEWLRALIQEMGITVKGPTVVKQDNQSTIKLAVNPVMHVKTKHFRVAQHYVRQLIKDNVITLEYMPTEDMLADILNKALSGPHFIRLRDKLMVGSKPGTK